MASSRDDFIIAIRSAFLKKSTQQKFSLLTLVFVSIFIVITLIGMSLSAIPNNENKELEEEETKFFSHSNVNFAGTKKIQFIHIQHFPQAAILNVS